jgi:hypothetical protein
MAKTLTNLRFGTRVYLDEAAQADFLDSEVDRSINYAMHDVVGNVIEVYEDFYNLTTPIQLSTVVNQQEYSIGNANLIKTRRVEINYNPADPNATALRATAIKTDEMPLRLTSNALGGTGLFSSGYYINGQVGSQIIGFTPVPQNAGINNISIWGIVTPSDLSSATDTLSIPYADRFAYLVELRAAGILLRKGQQAENYAAKYMDEYRVGIVEMKNFLKDRQSDGPWLIADALFEDTIFDHPM